MKRILVSLMAAAVAVGNIAAATASPDYKSDNISQVAHIPYEGASHLTIGGGYAYGGELNGERTRDQAGFEEKGGIRIFDITGKIRQVGFFPCPGNDLDIEHIKPGLITVGYHKAICAGDGEGVFTLDVSNPAKPKLLGSVTFPAPMQRNHATARYPGEDLVYAGGGGLGRGQETVTIVDVSKPSKPKITGTFLAAPRGCHDISFHFDKRGKFGFCAGLGETQIWDVADPLAPTVIARIRQPLTQFAHYAEVSPNGKLLAVNDEAITVNECVEEEVPAGAVWFYDISDIENPKELSYVSPPRGATGNPLGTFWGPNGTAGTCTSHDFNWIDNQTIAVPWYTGGFNVISVKDPANPKEIAYHQAEGTNVWTSKWHDGRIYTSDLGRGFEVFELKGF